MACEVRIVVSRKATQRSPVFDAHEDDGNCLIFDVSIKTSVSKISVHGPKTAGHGDECIRVFDEHHFAYEEMLKLDPLIEIRVGLLLNG